MRYAYLTPLFFLLSACEPTQFAGGTALPDGSVYKGDLQNGFFHGRGQLQWPNGNHYRGEFHHGLIRGQGLLTEADGCTYEGEFLNGEPHGKGRYACSENEWSGHFSEGELQKGTVKWNDGEVYSGEFLDYYPHGEGKLTQPDGTIIHATFRYGEAEGEGVQISTDAEGNTIEKSGYFSENIYYPSEDAWRAQANIPSAQAETRLYSESDRLQNAIGSLAPQRPGVRDVYTLLVGGDGTSPVFARELDWVAERIDEAFGVEKRVLRLSNGGGYSFPLATRTSIQESLNALDQLLDPQEDLLFVHLVSHGARNGDLKIAEGKMPLMDLSVADGKKWLDNLNAQYQWIVISACYSGQWIEPLSTPSRIVFTSAADNRTSFGCSDDSQRTWFSAALYGNALQQGTKDPKAWFNTANQKVTEMEKEQEIEEDSHSLPQHSIGENFLTWWKKNKDG